MFRKLPDSTMKAVTLSIDGVRVECAQGETVAAVLLRQQECWARLSTVSQAPRAPYCMMGVCFDCLAIVDGVASVQTCLTAVRDGMIIERQRGRPEAA